MDIGSRLRRLREGRNLTQEALAALSGVSRPWLSEVEGGKQSPRLRDLERLLDALGETLTGFFTPSAPNTIPGANPSVPPGRWPSGSTQQPVTLPPRYGLVGGHEQREPADVNRRDFLRVGALGGFGFALDPGRLSLDGVGGSLPNSALASIEPANAGFIDMIHQSIQHLVVMDNLFGADQIAGTAVLLFRSVIHRLTAGLYEPSIEGDLMAAASELGELAGWLLFDADQQESARHVNQAAIYWATVAGDQGMVDFILTNVSLQAIHLQRPHEAWRVAERLLHNESRLSPRIGALVYVREGRTYALMGNERDAVRDFEKARSLFLDGARVSDPPWAWWVDDFEITGHEGLCHREAGDSKGAVELLQQAIEACPASRVRDRYMYHAHLLNTLVDLGEWRQTIEVLDRTGPFVREIASGRVASLLISATTRIKGADGMPLSVRDGAKHLDGLLAQAGYGVGKEL